MTTLDMQTLELGTTTLPLIRSRLLGDMAWIRHGITTRVRGLGRAEGNVGYTAPRDVADAWEMRRHWTLIAGLDPDRIVRVRQLHGDGVLVATEPDGMRGGRPEAVDAPIADAIVTSTPGLALMTLHADCLPILLADRRRMSVAAVHAGWRGTVADVAGATVRRMVDHLGADPRDIVAFIGPGIELDAFEVGDEVVTAFRERWPLIDAVERRGPRWHVDLKRANARQLELAGVPSCSVEISPLCTVRNQDRLFSHRAQGPTTGRFAAIIGIATENRQP